jgi:hypothetical protein
MNLTVTASTRRTAILSALADLCFFKVGERLRVTELMSAWMRIPLRGDDLSTGLNECFFDGILDFAVENRESTVSLTHGGKAWIDSAHGRNEFATQMRVLAAAQRRRSVAEEYQAPFFRDRRLSDPSRRPSLVTS